METETKIIILGGSSFVGLSLVNLLKKNFKITSTYYKKKIKSSIAINRYKFDFKNQFFFTKLKNFDIIIHLATQKKLLTQKNYLKDETLFLEKITNYCLKKNKKLIYLSSSLVYSGKNNNSETSKKITFHKNEYINTKLCFDKIISNKIKLGLKVLMLRVPSIYGTNLGNINMISLNKKKLLSNKKINFYKSSSNNIRFVYVEDICKVIKKSIKLKINGIYNLESGENIKILNIIKYLKNKLKSKSKIEIINKKIDNIIYPNLNIMKIKKIFKITPQQKFMLLLRKIK